MFVRVALGCSLCSSGLQRKKILTKCQSLLQNLQQLHQLFHPKHLRFEEGNELLKWHIYPHHNSMKMQLHLSTHQDPEAKVGIGGAERVMDRRGIKVMHPTITDVVHYCLSWFWCRPVRFELFGQICYM